MLHSTEERTFAILRFVSCSFLDIFYWMNEWVSTWFHRFTLYITFSVHELFPKIRTLFPHLSFEDLARQNFAAKAELDRSSFIPVRRAPPSKVSTPQIWSKSQRNCFEKVADVARFSNLRCLGHASGWRWDRFWETRHRWNAFAAVTARLGHL